MNLNELREAMTSDATKENAALCSHIKHIEEMTNFHQNVDATNKLIRRINDAEN